MMNGSKLRTVHSCGGVHLVVNEGDASSHLSQERLWETIIIIIISACVDELVKLHLSPPMKNASALSCVSFQSLVVPGGLILIWCKLNLKCEGDKFVKWYKEGSFINFSYEFVHIKIQI